MKLIHPPKVYFRIFDTDGDQKITERDLEKVMDILGRGEELTAEQKYTIVQNIMSECSQGKGYIDPNGLPPFSFFQRDTTKNARFSESTVCNFAGQSLQNRSDDLSQARILIMQHIVSVIIIIHNIIRFKTSSL